MLYCVLLNKLEVVLLNAGESLCSSSSFTKKESNISTSVSSTFAAAELKLPVSSWNFTRYVPGSAGTITSVAFPGAASTIFCPDAKVAAFPVSAVCLTNTDPPYKTSKAVD